MFDTVIVNKKSVKNNAKLKKVQKESARYYKHELHTDKKNAPKAVINKMLPVDDISFVPYLENSTCAYDESLIDTMDSSRLIALCEDNKLNGRSGSGFPIATKLAAIKDGATLIINGAECDPALIHDAWLYRNRFKDIEYSVRLLRKCFNFDRIILATKEYLQETAHFEQLRLRNVFPMGFEKTLVKKCLGIELAADELPGNRNIMVMNIQSVICLGELINTTSLVNTRYITVADFVQAKGFVTRIPFGEPIEKLAHSFSLKPYDTAKLYCGGGALYAHETEKDEAANEFTSMIALANAPDYTTAKKCVGCGKCIKNCPSKVNIKAMIKLLDKGQPITEDLAKTFRLSSCIGCGGCTYNCNAGKDTRILVMQNGGFFNDN